MRSKYRIAALCFGLALMLRVGILFGTGAWRMHDLTELRSVAIHFAHTGEIGNPYMALATGPTAHVAPLYPMMLGGIYRIFGEGETGETVKELLSCVVSSA